MRADPLVVHVEVKLTEEATAVIQRLERLKGVQTLTPEERRQLSVCAVGACGEIEFCLEVIERLTGEKITPADEVRE